MKLGLFLLILGSIMTAVGIAGWMYADPSLDIWGVGQLSLDEARMVEAGGIGAAIIGAGFALGGIIRMVVKR